MEDGVMASEDSPATRVGPAAYASWRASTLGAVTEQLERRLLLRLVGDLADQRVLDAGCGDGTLSLAMARLGVEVTGIDADSEMLAAARASADAAGIPVTFVQGRLDGLPFPEGSFDVVVAVTVLCFVRDADVALAEMARVLRPGGRLVIGELGRWSSWAVIRAIRGRLGHHVWSAVRHRTSGELRSLLEASGISPITVRGAVYYPPIGWLARRMAGLDDRLGHRTTVGAALIVIAGEKR
jgi:2-polyprenyl-3-methyl-5-hydroxy-6-metoxy-1,4-benzoquinol methylase